MFKLDGKKIEQMLLQHASQGILIVDPKLGGVLYQNSK